jgi:chromosomal replication initiation ATPase DnaA
MTQPNTAPFVQLPAGYKPHRPDVIVTRVLKYARLTLQELQVKDRSKRVKEARFICAAMLQHYCEMKLVEIADVLGYKEHTAVLHGIRTLKIWVETGDKITVSVQHLAPEMIASWQAENRSKALIRHHKVV